MLIPGVAVLEEGRRERGSVNEQSQPPSEIDFSTDKPRLPIHAMFLGHTPGSCVEEMEIV